MIEWDLTQRRFGITISTVSKRKHVTVKCDTCGDIRDTLYDSCRKAMNRFGNTLCNSCRVKETRIIHADSYSESDKRRKVALSKTFKKKWDDPEYRAKMTVINQATGSRPEFKGKMSKISRNVWGNEECVAKMLHNNAEARKRPEWKIKASENSKRNWADQVYRDKVIASVKMVFDTDEYKAKMKALYNLPEVRDIFMV